MDFILNSKTKKVEIFYESAAEQQAILNFMSQYLTYREDKTSPNLYVHDDGISWASITGTTTPYTITNNSNVTDSIRIESINCSTDTALASHTEALSNGAKTYTDLDTNLSSATKLDNTSDEGGYSCLTAYVPRPSKTK